MTTETFSAVRVAALAILAGAVLQADTAPAGADRTAIVTAGRGIIVDWRSVRSGEEIQTGADPFGTAQLFVALVGPEAATAAATRDHDVEPAPEPVEPPPRVHAFRPDANGRRRRSFDVGDFRVQVEGIDWLDVDDGAVETFTTKLAAAAAFLVT